MDSTVPENGRRVSLFRKLIAGSNARRTRLHSETGDLVPLSRAIRNGPRALATGLLRLAFDRRPSIPWISYDAQALLGRLLTPASEVLEYGSGMSTIWLGARAGHVLSIENNEGWYETLAPRLQALGNVDCRFSADPSAYAAMADDKRYDLILIDGSWRDACAEFAVAHLKPGGTIYLDNSDMGVNPLDTGDIPKARRLLLDFAAREDLAAREFVDFAPTQLFVQRGLMIGPPAR